MRSKDGLDDHKEIKGKVNLKEMPTLEWSWKMVTLPKGGSSHRARVDCGAT